MLEEKCKAAAGEWLPGQQNSRNVFATGITGLGEAQAVLKKDPHASSIPVITLVEKVKNNVP